MCILQKTTCLSSTDEKGFFIGGSGPLTGDYATYGTSVKQGAELAAKEINENGIELSDFTSHDEKDILKITLKFCKYNNANFFSDNRLENIDILINVISYDGYKFADEMYYYSDFIMRVDDNFKVYCRTAEVI